MEPFIVHEPTKINGFRPPSSSFVCLSLRVGVLIISLLYVLDCMGFVIFSYNYLREVGYFSSESITGGKRFSLFNDSDDSDDTDESIDITNIFYWVIYTWVAVCFGGLAIAIMDIIAAIKGFNAYSSSDAIDCVSALNLSQTMRIVRILPWSGWAGLYAVAYLPSGDSFWSFVFLIMLGGGLIAYILQAYFSLVLLGYKEEIKDGKNNFITV
eukprot:CAMPEP_0114981628 /NCGR_PEP_ID=MMETSP0216-20121206/5645_1 /TAXON_ID=223996 /ORGANISM="Protocruzia adherens, Strain Boccale" /LENGTH=211 /DNA_ID=CAMNT_0002343311 /DNA_START=240 /DNA_END=875 /DNA_ORIENTATION=-